MKRENELFFRTAAEVLKLLAKGIDSVAEKVDDLSRTAAQKAAETRADVGKEKEEEAPVEKPQPEKKETTRTKKTTTDKDAVYQSIASHEKGASVAEVSQKTGFENQKIHRIVYQLKKEGKITSPTKGVYKAS